MDELDRTLPEQIRAAVRAARRLGSGTGAEARDIQAIAAGAGLDVVELPDGLVGRVVENLDGRSISGALEFSTGRIWVDGRESAPRRRFTIAHELAHELLGHEELLGEGPHVVVDPEPGSRVAPHEREADLVASLLLMPTEALVAQVARIGAVSVPLLAEAFDVSAPAMQHRLRSLGLLQDPWAWLREEQE